MSTAYWEFFVDNKRVSTIDERNRGFPWGHSITGLLKEIRKKVNIPEEILEDAQLLDAYYISV